MGKLCDDGCEAYFNKISCTITKKGKLVLSGTRTANSQLWIADEAKYRNALYYDAAKVNNFSQAAEPQATINSSSALASSHVANALCPEPHLAARIPFSMQRSSLHLSPPYATPSMQDCYIPCQGTSPPPKSENIFASPKQCIKGTWTKSAKASAPPN